MVIDCGDYFNLSAENLIGVVLYVFTFECSNVRGIFTRFILLIVARLPISAVRVNMVQKLLVFIICYYYCS